jgi:hypothetical protein
LVLVGMTDMGNSANEKIVGKRVCLLFVEVLFM